MHDDREGFETRTWKSHGITHAVLQKAVRGLGFGTWASVFTRCGTEQPNLPWRNTSRFQLSKIDCMGCLVGLSRL